MVIYVIITPTLEQYDQSGGRFEIKRRLEKLSGEPCLVLHYSQVTPALMKELRPKALLLGGFGSSFQEFEVSSFYQLEEVIKAGNIPILAICGSHQLLGFMYNLDIRSVSRLMDEPMRQLRPGEPDVRGDYHPGFFKEFGFYPIHIVQDDPIFEGLPNPFIVYESHYCEVKKLPSDFVLLASTEECRIQAMRHKNHIIYGVQFHPECYNDTYLHGKIILENFFKISGAFNP
ncbi:MAG: gamma-glutamyl-gamma-aminobutyrate hydrolase family protein [Armatimonadetes bacterium]|nr:gamma-glutamyl-gamma-aminobutyrate hydrolase family protein [Armatimonadota bacterium]